MSEGNERNCYCQPGQTSCGTCERCGRPGHTRHFPGPVPATGAWCDGCYRFVARTHPSNWLRYAWVPIVVGILLWRLLQRG